MGIFLLAAFIGIPILEISVFIQVGGLIGLWPTIATVVITALAGTALLRHQGLATLNRARANLEAGGLPLKEVFDGACLLVAGALLLTPGFVTDGIGLLLMTPPVRDALRIFLGRHVQTRVHTQGGQHPGAHGGMGRGNPGKGPGTSAHPPFGENTGFGGNPRPSSRGPVIEGEFTEITPDEPAPNSPWRGEEPSSEPDPDKKP